MTEKEKYIRIVSENRRLIYKVCQAYCADPDDRKDLEQDILVKLWKALDKFDGRVKISTWIYKIALNTAISYCRGEGKRKGKKSSLDPQVISLPDPLEADHEKQKNIEWLYRFIDQLKELDKAVILLYLDDIKYSEISKIMGITETNVATKINRIKEKLRKKFAEI